MSLSSPEVCLAMTIWAKGLSIRFSILSSSGEHDNMMHLKIWGPIRPSGKWGGVPTALADSAGSLQDFDNYVWIPLKYGCQYRGHSRHGRRCSNPPPPIRIGRRS
jgi:hypothetical protein